MTLHLTPPKPTGIRPHKYHPLESPMYYDYETLRCEKEQKVRMYMGMVKAEFFGSNVLSSVK